MVNIPVKFKRVAAAFDEMSRVRSFESSGSEHSADLSDLVNSFLEKEITEPRSGEDDYWDGYGDEIDYESDQSNSSPDFELQDCLRKLFDRENDDVKRSICDEVENALEVVGGGGNKSPEFKRRLMARLRSGGFDAGLCKSKWEKDDRNPSGNHEYIDVNAAGRRYIVEVNLAGEFTIARPTASYSSLLDIFPPIFIGEPQELKQVVRKMSRAIRKSLKSVDLNMPPWRRLGYMQAKWFGYYKRTVNETPCAKLYKSLAGDRLVGFAPATATTGVPLYCRGDFAAKNGVGIGNLAASLNGR